MTDEKMTDEKMAEESLISYRKESKWAGKIFMQDENTSYKDGFLAGLKYGRPKWHKVADGILPDNYRYVWTNVGAGYYDDEGWYDDFGRLQGVIAWCEPEFKEVEK